MYILEKSVDFYNGMETIPYTHWIFGGLNSYNPITGNIDFVLQAYRNESDAQNVLDGGSTLYSPWGVTWQVATNRTVFDQYFATNVNIVKQCMDYALENNCEVDAQTSAMMLEDGVIYTYSPE